MLPVLDSDAFSLLMDLFVAGDLDLDAQQMDAPPPPTEPGAAAEVVDSPPPILRLASDTLADIFLRLPDLADIGRTAAACPAFRRVVSDPSFKRRLRRAHRAPLLGFLFCIFHPAEAPHSSAPFARALERAADLCFSYLHSPQPFTRWYPLDARDGRVVLGHTSSTSFVVADPLYRRCLLLPPIPVLAAAPQHPFLFPATGDEASSFTVGCMAEGEPGLMLAFVYSSVTREWSDLHMVTTLSEPKPSYACGSFYWKFTADTLLVLDTHEMEFSFVEIPTTYGERDFVVAEAGEGRTGIFSIRHGDGWEASSSLICAIKQDAGDGEGAAGVKWHYKRRIALPPQYRHSFAGASDRHLLLHRAPRNLRTTTSDENSGSGYFSVESATLKMERVCGLGQLVDAVPYVGFPPSLCLPSI
jgi:hypothetical protein